MQAIQVLNIKWDSLKNRYFPWGVDVDVLRLDAIHPFISGNKWFKLSGYLQEAVYQSKKKLLTFGGPYSNHILSTAAACHEANLSSIGIIRGEKPTSLSDTLVNAKNLGMQLFFTSREAYRTKQIPEDVWKQHAEEEVYRVEEGGYGQRGAEGASRILSLMDTQKYTHILLAVGTGTTVAGLVSAALPHQQVTGVCVLKNEPGIESEIKALLAKPFPFTLLHNYHFGGYAKKTAHLLQFMNDWFKSTGIPSDFVYTGKLFYAADDLIRTGKIKKGSSVLLIHTGGLQGNHSLPKGTLIF